VAEFILRPPQREEADAIAALINAHSVALNGGAELAAADIRQWFDNPTFDVERDARVAIAPDGTLVGYADVGDPADRHTRYWIDLRLPLGADPAIGHALVDAMEARARETALEGARLRGIADSGDEAARRLYEERGYELVRHSFRMRADLDEPVPPPEWPEGVELQPFDAERDARAVYEADTEAFRDHWEFSLTPYEEWEHWSLAREDFDPTLWFVARDGDEIAGVALCRPHSAEEGMGYVNDLAVRRPWRRRGLGLALLRHSLGEFGRRGYRSVTLDVDAENLTGAVRLYERAGMRVDRRRDTLDRPLADEG
jgi:mycothiol synthase